MNATDLFPALRNLSRDEKIKVLQFLKQELQAEAEQQLLQLFQPGATYHIWSLCTTHQAAWQLAELLEKDQR